MTLEEKIKKSYDNIKIVSKDNISFKKDRLKEIIRYIEEVSKRFDGIILKFEKKEGFYNKSLYNYFLQNKNKLINYLIENMEKIYFKDDINERDEYDLLKFYEFFTHEKIQERYNIENKKIDGEFILIAIKKTFEEKKVSDILIDSFK